MKKLLYCLLLPVAVCTILAGCYNIGSVMHPQVKSIYISPVVNETLTPFAAAEMRGLLSEQFVIDGSLKVKDKKEADCILYCKVTDVKITEQAQQGYDSNRDYRASEWLVSVTAEFTVIIPSHKEPLISKRTVSGSAVFSAFGDKNVMQTRGIRQACRGAAQMAVQYTTEAW